MSYTKLSTGPSVYKIGTAARMVGVSVAAIRNWEHRYRLVVPVRNNGGQRLYSREHIDKLLWLKTQIDHGFSAGEAHNLLHTGLEGPDRDPGPGWQARAEAERIRAEAAAARARAATTQARSAQILNRIARTRVADADRGLDLHRPPGLATPGSAASGLPGDRLRR
jgi:DNA-binding transcriptional MerR regulator